MFTRENNYLSEQLFLEHTGATFSELLRHDLWKVNGKGAVEARNVFRTLPKISDVVFAIIVNYFYVFRPPSITYDVIFCKNI